jgi:hypothetical protein
MYLDGSELQQPVYWLPVLQFPSFVHHGAWVEGADDAESQTETIGRNIANATMSALKAGKLLSESQS